MKTKFKRNDVVMHRETQGRYVICYTPEDCCIEKDCVPAYAYRPEENPLGTLWIRPQVEMEDGRFKKAKPRKGRRFERQ